jgi:hypothetical protein
MTSVSGGYNQVPPNSLYINLVAVQSSIVDSNNNPVPWVVAYGALSTAGTVLFRDMGRQNIRPDPTVPTSVGGQSSIFRKVQLVTTGGAGGYYGTGNSSICGAGSGTDFYTGYIKLGGFTFGGGVGIPSGFARLN